MVTDFMRVAGSKRNSSIFTFDGVDVMGDRLAEEVCYETFIYFADYHETFMLENVECFIHNWIRHYFSHVARLLPTAEK